MRQKTRIRQLFRWLRQAPVPGIRHGRLCWMLYFPGEEALGLAVAVAIGNQRSYYESKCRRLRTGWNRNLVYSLDDAAWKSAGSRWEHSEAVPADEVVQIFLLLYPPPAQEAVVFDNIRIGYAAAAALP